MKTNDSSTNLAWKFNWFRQSELEGGLLLGKIACRASNDHLIRRLTQHAAEEVQHASIWAQTIADLHLPFIRIRRSYQSFYSRHGGTPTSLLDVLSFTQVFEQRVHRRFHEELKSPGLPQAAARAYQSMIEDEKDHLHWVAEWLKKQPEAPARLAHYRQVDQQVFKELAPFEDRLWEIPGLGDDPALHQAA